MTKKKGPDAWQEITTGCVVFQPGSASEYHTGSWRAQRPVWNIKNASSAVFAISFVRRAAFSKAKTVFSRQIWITAKGAAFVLTNAGRGQ
jgi:Pyruvate/2-oxoacid:ferredoxin oxidoreductase delta subunit